MLKIEYRVLSEPAEVWWAGFRSDTLRLQQEGWEIAAEEDVAYDRIRLLLRHQDLRLYALTDDVQYRYRAIADPRFALKQPQLVFRVVRAAPRFEVLRSDIDFAAFRQVDAKPQFEHSVEVKSLEDFRIFATPLARTEEIIVEPQTVSAMLDQIRKMQAPEQARIREQQRAAAARESRVADAAPRQAFHAQIISLAERRAA